MDLSIVLEQRFVRTPEGEVFTDSAMHHAFWNRYLRDFTNVRIVARVADVPRPPEGWNRVDGHRVSIHAVPHYVGPTEFLMRRGAVIRSLRQAMDTATGAILLRTPGALANLAYRALRGSPSTSSERLPDLHPTRPRPYGVEVVGDPLDVFARGGVSHPLRPYFRYRFAWEQRRLCRDAAAAVYVTDSMLQRRYPTTAFSVSASNVELTDSSFAAGPRLDSPSGDHLRVVLVGSLEQLYKGPDVLLRAMARCRRDGVRIEGTFIGDGRRRKELEAVAKQLDLSERVRFIGHLPGPMEVRKRVDEADAFVLPSRTEGLPRAMLEAMARGLPCLGSTAGGIPELLPPEAMSAPGDDFGLARNLVRLAKDTSFRHHLATTGFETARRYHESILDGRRRSFYRELARATSAWLNGHAARLEMAS